MESTDTRQYIEAFTFIESISLIRYINKSSTHTHDSMEIGYVVSGQGIYHLNGVDHKISSGDLIFLMPGDIHFESGSGKESVEILFLVFKNTMNPEGVLHLPFTSSTIIPTQNMLKITDILKSILIESLEQKKGFERFIEADLIQLFILLERISSGNVEEAIYSDSLSEVIHVRKLKMVSEVKFFIESNFNMQINLSNVARKFFISPQHLIRLFKEVTGCTPKQYLTDLRIKKAKELLVGTRKEILAISESIGYNDIHYFYRQFKKDTGCTPVQYRMGHMPEIK